MNKSNAPGAVFLYRPLLAGCVMPRVPVGATSFSERCVVYVRVHTRCKNGFCEIIQQFFETFGREKSCMSEQEPFLQCVNSHFYHNKVTYERLCDRSVVEWTLRALICTETQCMMSPT